MPIGTSQASPTTRIAPKLSASQKSSTEASQALSRVRIGSGLVSASTRAGAATVSWSFTVAYSTWLSKRLMRPLSPLDLVTGRLQAVGDVEHLVDRSRLGEELLVLRLRALEVAQP